MIKGSTITIGGLFGTCEVLGVLIGERVIRYVPDHIASITIFALGATTSTILKLVPLGQTAVYVLFVVQILCLGSGFNIAFIVQETRTAPKMLALSFEFNICLA